MASIADVVDGVFVQVLDGAPPTDAEWAAVLDLARRKKSEMRCGFIISDGGAPNAKQRKTLADDLADLAYQRRAVVTPSTVVRGAVTALSWFGHTMKAFSPSELEAALEYIEVPPPQRAKVLEAVRQMKAALLERSADR